MRYQNPVWPGYFADPFVLRHGTGYYAYGTGGPADHGRQSDGLMFPLLRSPDLVHWTYLGGALAPLNDPDSPAYWAPEVAERDGRFYMYYSAGGFEGEHHRVRVAVAERPEGPFEDTGHILFPDEPFSIDASPFRDPNDGRWYLFFARDFFDGDFPGTGAAVAPLADDMLSAAGPVTTVMRASQPWQVYERDRLWYGRVWPAWYTVEGPFTVFHEGRYICFYSGGRWETADYGVSYAVADHPLGPYTDGCGAKGPCVLHGIPGQVAGPGHNSVALAPDGRTPFVVYHAWNSEATARRMCIDPLLWTPDGPRCDGPSTEPVTLPQLR